MIWVQFEVPVSHMCLPGAMVACWSLTQEMAGCKGFEPFYYNNEYFVTEFCETFMKTVAILLCEWAFAIELGKE